MFYLFLYGIDNCDRGTPVVICISSVLLYEVFVKKKSNGTKLSSIRTETHLRRYRDTLSYLLADGDN